MAAAALSRRQTTQVCTQGRKKVKLIQKDYLDQLFLKKKSIVAERQIRTIIQFPHTILKLRKGNAPARAVGKCVPDQLPVQGDFQIAALSLSTQLSNSDVVKYPTVERSALKRTVPDIGLSAESVSKICFNLLWNHKIKKRKTLCW